MNTRRLQQFVSALTARISTDEQALIANFLRPAELRLFEQMPLFDRRHSLDVYHTLVRAGHIDPHLLKAALLHDCGKVDDSGRPIPLLYYGLFVILKAILPRLYWWAVRNGRGLLWPFVIHSTHDQRSAMLVARAGGHPDLVAILHDYGVECRLPATQLLSWADNQN
jgi:predicted HD phosphohydrolase